MSAKHISSSSYHMFMVTLVDQNKRRVYLKCDECRKDYTSPLSKFTSRKRNDGKDFCSAKCRKSYKHVTLVCANCGKQYERFRKHLEKSDSTCCSKACQYTQQKKGGIVCEKFEKAIFEKFGVTRPAQSKKVVEKMFKSESWRNTLFKPESIPWNTGKRYNQGDFFFDQWVETTQSRHVSKSTKRETWIEKIRVTAKKNYKSGRRVSGFALLSEAKKREMKMKSIRTLKKKGYTNVGVYMANSGQEFYYDSKWELDRMQEFDHDENILSWERCSDKIPYWTPRGVKKNYCPDFVLRLKSGQTIVEEVKGIFTNITLAKHDAALSYYVSRGIDYRVVTREQGSKTFKTITRDEVLEQILGNSYEEIMKRRCE